MRSNYSGFLLTQTVLNALRGKNTPAVEFETLLPSFANPFKQQDEKERAKARPYDPHSARLFDEAIRIGLVPEGIISILDFDLLKDAVKR